MAKSKVENYVNKTGTELELLQSIEKSFFRANGINASKHSEKAMDWFRREVGRNFNNVRMARMMRDRTMFKQKLEMGQMFLVNYDAKHKDTLPIWDKWPLIIPFNSYKAKNGANIILGLNFHYLPPKLRLVAFRALLKFRNEKRYRKSTRLQFDWQVVSALSEHELFKKAVHAYDANHFKSMFVKIPAQSWTSVLFLPLARWEGGSNQKAWSI